MALKEYNYEYEEGKLIRATELNVVFTDQIITSKTVVNTTKYYYDSEGNKETREPSPCLHLDVANAINKVDNIQDAAKVTMIGRDMKRVTNTANLVGKADDLYKVWKGYDTTATGMKKFLHNSISMAHNGGWLFGKLRQGYTVIDIGLSTSHKGRGLWYGTERFVLGLWETRNIWKLPINYYS